MSGSAFTYRGRQTFIRSRDMGVDASETIALLRDSGQVD